MLELLELELPHGTLFEYARYGAGDADDAPFSISCCCWCAAAAADVAIAADMPESAGGKQLSSSVRIFLGRPRFFLTGKPVEPSMTTGAA